MKALKRFFILTLCIILSLLFIISTDAASVYNRQKKSIFLVMDDSGSMSGTRERDANYALQTLLAMTDKNDSIKLYFLNNNSNQKLSNLSMSQKSNEMLSTIRTEYPFVKGNPGTRYTMVETAKQELVNSVQSQDATEYWLVVMTDGNFSGADAIPDLSAFATDPYPDDDTKSTLTNGTLPNVLFLPCGDKENIEPYTLPANKPTNFHCREYSALTDIITSMNEAAEIISGRVKIENATFTPDNQQISFPLIYPAKNIIVFTQGNPAQITDSKVEPKDATKTCILNTTENYTVQYPAKNNNGTLSSVCFITEVAGSSIKDGQITLTFNTKLDPKNTTILVEPAIGVIANYSTQDGPIDSLAQLHVGDTAQAKFSLCDSETLEPLPDSTFGETVTYHATLTGAQTPDNTPITSNEFSFKVQEKDVTLEFKATLPDGYILSLNDSCNNLPIAHIVSFSISNNGVFTKDYSELDGTEGVTATVLINGTAPSFEQFTNFDIKIRNDNIFTGKFEIQKNDNDGTFTIYPQKGLFGLFTAKQKVYQVTLTEKDGTEITQDLTIEVPGERPWMELVKFLIILSIIIYLIIVFATKKYFPWGMVFQYYANDIPDGQEYHAPTMEVSLSKAFWNEFKQIFKSGNFIFFRHLLVQLLPNQAIQVNLFDIADGSFSCITLHANKKHSLKLEDRSIRRDDEGRLEADFDLYDSDFTTRMDFNDIVVLNDKKLSIVLRITQVLAKSEDVGEYDTFTHYVRVTTKKEINNLKILW